MSKLGPHVLRPSNAALTWVAQAPIVKTVDQVQVLQGAPESALRVFRHYFASQDLIDPDGAVRAILGALGGYRHPNLYLEIWNEAHPEVGALRAAVAGLHKAGYLTCGVTWGTGDYTQEDFDQAVAAGVDALAPHCYWGNQGLTRDHALRYRQFWKPGYPPVLITECGRDAIEGGKAGWQISGITGDQYVQEMVAYNTEITKDTSVLGAVPFQSGNTTDWNVFNLDPITPQLMHALAGGPMPPVTVTKKMSFIDVSNLQGKIDWSLVAKSWPEAMIGKASQGTWYTDSFFPANWQQSLAHGLARGAYAFGEPGRESGHDNAEFFLSRVDAAGGWQSGDLPVLDLEWDTGIDPDADLLAYTIDWLQIVEAAVGCKPWLYSRQEYLSRHNLLDASLANYGLWLAAYDPSIWPATPGQWPFLAAWQYGQGSVPGIQYAVDHDLFNGTKDLFLKYGKP